MAHNRSLAESHIRVALLTTLLSTAMLFPSHAAADGGSSPVIARNLGEWSVRWWQWALAVPKPANPMLDTTGAACDTNQRGPVWFLAGYFGDSSTPIERKCNLSKRKYILFPVANTIWVQTPTDDPSFTEDDYRRLASEFLPPSVGGDLEATLDGKPILYSPHTPITRTQSPVFTATFPDDNVFGQTADQLTGFPIVSDGWWVLLPPLSPGEHVLHFRAGAKQNITYRLTVGNRHDD